MKFHRVINHPKINLHRSKNKIRTTRLSQNTSSYLPLVIQMLLDGLGGLDGIRQESFNAVEMTVKAITSMVE